MNIYLGSETNFNNNGLGFLTDPISVVVHDELNNNYELRLEYAINGNLSEYLKEDNIIKCKVWDNTYQLFRITNVEKTFKIINVVARHIFYDLLNNFLADTYPQNLNGQNFLQHILNNTNFATNFQPYSDIINTRTARYVRVNPVQAIMGDIDNSMVNIFGGEVKRDNFNINFLSRVGNNNGVKLLFGKNINGINISVDITDMATRVMPQGFDGLLLPELYVDSPNINNYPTPKIIKIDFSDVVYDPDDENAYHTLDEAYAALRAKVQEQFSLGLDKPRINIEVDWIELSKTKEYEQYSNLETVRLGDTIIAQILGINYETRVIAIDYNVLKDRITNFQIGTFRPSIASQINTLQNSLEKINPSSIIQSATDKATQLITTAMGGYVYKTQSELYIMDNQNPNLAQKVWRWNINGLGYSSTGINGPYGIAMTMDGSIVANFITSGVLNTSVIQGYDQLTIQVQDNKDAIGDRTGKTTTITQDINSIQAQISDIADITTSASSNEAYIDSNDLQQIANSFPIRIEIYPINEQISYLYPSTNLKPSNTLFPKDRYIKFTNVSTNEVFTYTLPKDLLYYDSNNYDTFVADYESDLITIVKRCKTNADGTIGLLDNPETYTYDFSTLNIYLTEGNYQVELPGYSSSYLFVRLMVLNAYTAQYATKVELTSAITQTVNNIETSVSQTYTTKTESQELSTRISQSVSSISLTANDNGTSCGLTIQLKNEDGTTLSSEQANITLNGLVKFTDLSGTGTTTINGANIITGTLNADKINGGTISGSSISLGSGNFTVNTSGVVNAKSGSIGGWNLNGTSGFTSGNSSISSNGELSLYPTTGGVYRIASGAVRFNANGGIVLATSSNGSVYAATGNLDLKACSGYDAYLGCMINSNGTGERSSVTCKNGELWLKSSGVIYANHQIVVSSSSKATKENIIDLSQEQKNELYDLIKNIPFKQYDYKKEYGRKFNYGFIIEDIENTKLNKLLHISQNDINKDIKTYSTEDLARLELIIIQELMKKLDRLEGEQNGK